MLHGAERDPTLGDRGSVEQHLRLSLAVMPDAGGHSEERRSLTSETPTQEAAGPCEVISVIMQVPCTTRGAWTQDTDEAR